MKITLERTALLKALGNAQGVVERRNTIPILANVLIEADDNGATFRASDLDIEAIERADAIAITPGAVTAPAHMFHEIARKLPDGSEVELFVNDETGRLEVSAGRSRFSLSTLPREDFPTMEQGEYAANFSIRAGDLKRLFEKCKFAISTEEARYYLNGVYMHIADTENGRKLRCVATDGHRLAMVDQDMPEGAEDIPAVIVPRKTVNELRKMYDADADAEIKVSISETKIRFATERAALTSKVIDGSYPDYTRVIPVGNSRRLEVDADTFATAIDRVSTVASERSRAVKLVIDQDRLTLSVTSPDNGAATEELAAAYDDTPMEIGFNSKYVLEVTSQMERENAVFMFADAAAPALVREGDDESCVYVLMPMRV